MNDATYVQQELVAEPSQPAVFVNARCLIYEVAGMCTVMLNGQPIARYHRDDLFGRDMFIAQAQEAGYAQGQELAAAFGLHPRTMYRIRDRYRADGAHGLVRKKMGPKGSRLGQEREALIRRWQGEGHSAYWMAQQLKVSWPTVARALARMGLATRQQQARQASFLETGEQESTDANESHGGGEGSRHTAVDAGPSARGLEDGSTAGASQDAPDAETSTLAEPTFDDDPQNREMDRMLARQGLIDDAAPVFGSESNIPRGGVLLAIPALVDTGIFNIGTEVYGTLGPAFYGLRTMLLTMVVLALLRIKHPENVKEYSPGDLGRILGMDRIPEVKTIRRKLGLLADDSETAERFVTALTKRRAQRAGDALGYLYVDGHVRVYHGSADLPKMHVARMRISMPATQDVWLNDANGDPVFVLTQEPNAQLVSTLPEVLANVRPLVGDRRVTVVFDRGGWSPDLFKRMDAAKFDVLTYRKGKAEKIPDEAFTTHKVLRPPGQQAFELHDTTIVLRNGFRMRQITRRKGDHQTHIVTTRTDLTASEVAYRMFDRWRQENFFRYMRQEYAIDSLIEYGAEPDDAERTVPNPARKAVSRELAAAKRELTKLEAEYGRACTDGRRRQQVRRPEFEPIYGMYLLQPLEAAGKKVSELQARRRKLPARVPIGEIKDEVVRLRQQKKRLSDALKMVAYQAETDLTRAVGPHYARSLHEGRRLIRAALSSSADIEPIGGELRVTLAPQSSPNRSRALAELCRELNATRTVFPGSSLRLHYAVRGLPHDT